MQLLLNSFSTACKCWKQSRASFIIFRQKALAIDEDFKIGRMSTRFRQSRLLELLAFSTTFHSLEKMSVQRKELLRYFPLQWCNHSQKKAISRIRL